MEYPFIHTDVYQRLLQNLSLRTSQGIARPGWQDFMPAYFPEIGSTFNCPPGDNDPMLSRPQMPSLRYSPLIMPLADGHDPSRVIWPLDQHMSYLGPDPRIPPPPNLHNHSLHPQHVQFASGFVPQDNNNISGNTGFDFGEPHPRLLDLSFPSDPLGFRIQTMSSPGTRSFFDTSSPRGFPPLNTLPSSTPLELHLPTTSSSSTDPLFGISPSGILLPPNALPSSDPLGLRPLMASSSSTLPLLDLSSSSGHSPRDITPSSDPFELHFLTTTVSNNEDSPPHDLLDLQSCVTSSTRNSTPASTRTTGSPEPTSSQGLSSDPIVVAVQTVPSNPPNVDMTDPNNVSLFVRSCGRGVHECLWRDEGKACKNRGPRTAVKRHVARVHFGIRCVMEFSVTPTTDAESTSGTTGVRTAKRSSTARMTLPFT